MVGLLRRLYAHDASTHDHCRSVGAWSGLLAKALQLDLSRVKLAMLAGTLHDIGKARTPVVILLKPGPLDAHEWNVMRAHAGDGGAMLDRIPALRPIASIVRHHHERVDGRGYPAALAGEGIPLLARIIAVSDSFHAMITTRPYRPAVSVSEALDLLRAGGGSQWDVAIVDKMVELVGAKMERASLLFERSARAS